MTTSTISYSNVSSTLSATPFLGGVRRIHSTGKELDEETGYGYFGARYYDATLLTS